MKHKYYDVIVAWAKGKKIQYRGTYDSFYDDSDWTDFEGSLLDENKIEWRIKPAVVIRRYRIALMSDKYSNAYFKLQNENDENLNLENFPAFVKWITDWVDYTIE